MGGITTAQNDAPSRALEAHRTAHLGAVVVHVAIADGADWRTVDLPGGITTALCHDIRSYYEEATLDLVTGALPGPHALVDWFVERTLTGRVVLAACGVIRASARIAGPVPHGGCHPVALIQRSDMRGCSLADQTLIGSSSVSG